MATFTFSMTLGEIEKLGPCGDRFSFAKSNLPARKKITAAQAREAGCTLNDMVWLASAVARKNAQVERRLRHWLADCAAHVLHIYERDYPADTRVRNAIRAARDYADGRIDGAARAAAWAAASAAAWAAAWAAARDAASAAARDAAWDAAWAAERVWQFDRLVMWLSVSEPEPMAFPTLELAEA